jgi:hypothetical protein
MGYTRFSVVDFSSRLCRRESALEAADPTIRDAEGMDCSLGKLSLISGFLQEIAAGTLPSDCLHPKANRSRAPDCQIES